MIRENLTVEQRNYLESVINISYIFLELSGKKSITVNKEGVVGSWDIECLISYAKRILKQNWYNAGRDKNGMIGIRDNDPDMLNDLKYVYQKLREYL